jgi:hypothetical protein
MLARLLAPSAAPAADAASRVAARVLNALFAAAPSSPPLPPLPASGGEIDPSDKGHEGAGQFSGEAFCFSGSVLQGAGAAQHEHGQGGWCRLQPGGDAPGPRGWFAAAALPDGSMVVHGGMNDANERLSDLYRLCLH